MGERRILGDGETEVVLRRRRGLRRISLRVSQVDGRVTLSVPASVPEAEALGFANSRLEWIAKARGRAAPPLSVGPGTVLPVRGQPTTVVARDQVRARLDGGALIVPAHRAGRAAQGVLRALARDDLSAVSNAAAEALGRRYTKLTLRDPRSRWGSCSAQGGLMYSWRLILAPPSVLRYVAVHEAAHLEHLDHSPAFWATVERLMPGWRAERDWLRREGLGLHRYRFED